MGPSHTALTSSPHARRVALFTSLLLLCAGCPEPTTGPDAGADAGPTSTARLVFMPRSGPIDFGDVPFPDDLYLDASGRLELGALPSESMAFPSYAATMRSAGSSLDGFGALGPIYFRVDGAIDPASLPSTGADSLGDDASVFLVDADPASPSAFDRIPVEVRWDPATSMLALRPRDGHALRAGRSYAAVVTNAVRGSDGLPLSPADAFRTVRDAASRPTDPALAEAWDHYGPVLANVGAARVVGVAVFRVQTVERTLADARTIVRAGDAPTVTIERAITGADLDALLGVPESPTLGLDVPGGVLHEHVGWVIDGRFTSPNFMSPEPQTHGAFTRDDDGALIVQRQDDVWFTLVLPAGDLGELRTVIFQHGLGSDRSNVFSIAEALCAQGWAVLAIDIPFHGMRADVPDVALDRAHAFGPGEGPDLFGDTTGDAVYLAFVGAADEDGALSAFHPFYVRDVIRQSVVDLMSASRVIDEHDWSTLSDAGGPSDLTLADAPIGFVGVSLGGIVGTTFVTAEADVGAAVLNVTGGALTHIVSGSPSFRGAFLPLLAPRVGLSTEILETSGHEIIFRPELALYQMFLDGGDSMTFGPILGERPIDVLFQMAVDDETLPNSATEGLARALQRPDHRELSARRQPHGRRTNGDARPDHVRACDPRAALEPQRGAARRAPGDRALRHARRTGPGGERRRWRRGTDGALLRELARGDRGDRRALRTRSAVGDGQRAGRGRIRHRLEHGRASVRERELDELGDEVQRALDARVLFVVGGEQIEGG